jgi:hypothetical protein
MVFWKDSLRNWNGHGGKKVIIAFFSSSFSVPKCFQIQEVA